MPSTGHLRSVVVYFADWAKADPLAALTAAVDDALSAAFKLDQVNQSKEMSFIDVVRSWEERPRQDFGDQRAPLPRFHVILDQTEEYFANHPGDAGGFVAGFSQAVRDPGVRTTFLISIREDAYSRLDQFEAQIPGLFSNFLRLDFLDVGSAEAAIRQPIGTHNKSRVGERAVVVEDQLVGEVIRAIRRNEFADGRRSGRISIDEPLAPNQRVETAYLQLIMSRLWEAVVQEDGHTLNVGVYERLGGASGITEAYLYEAMGALKPEAQEDVSAAFRYLVTPSGVRLAMSVDDLAKYLVPAQGLGEGGGSATSRPCTERTFAPPYRLGHGYCHQWQTASGVRGVSRHSRKVHPGICGAECSTAPRRGCGHAWVGFVSRPRARAVLDRRGDARGHRRPCGRRGAIPPPPRTVRGPRGPDSVGVLGLATRGRGGRDRSAQRSRCTLTIHTEQRRGCEAVWRCLSAADHRSGCGAEGRGGDSAPPSLPATRR